jgi:tetratricopeptide (TPR) repeat protein
MTLNTFSQSKRSQIIRYGTLFILCIASSVANAQNAPATVKESKKVFTTYEFSDPDPVPEMGRIYPYYRFDGYTNASVQKEWKIVELENDFIKVMILPEIGGKIWGAWDKATGKPFIYYNQVVKFRDVAMRGPWTSGGIEANYGIIGHTPNCATPMDYLTETKADGSVSCYIGTLDLLTQTYWTIEINLPKDKAYFTTRSFWSNATPLEQPYYTWMNVGLPADGNLEFVYPGNRYIGHAGEYSDWTIHPENKKDISFYQNNNFGRSKSYHIIGKYSDFFGAYYHDHDFGMARYSLRDEKPGRKIWIWGLSRQGMIWENLLSDIDGQYVEVQSGRLFNQASVESNKTPFKQLGFAPHTSDEWTEYWFPVKGTKGFVKANGHGALNVRAGKSTVKIDFLPLHDLSEEFKVTDGRDVVYSKKIDLKTLQPFSDSFDFSGNPDSLIVTLGETKMRYSANPEDGLLGRPVAPPQDFDWTSAYGLWILGKELIQQRMYLSADENLKAALEKDPHFLPALTDMAMLAYRNMDYRKSLEYARHGLSIDTYDPAANFYYGLVNTQLGNITDAKDGFDIASLSPSYRGAAYSELSRIYLNENDHEKALRYAEKSLELNTKNTASWQIIALISRLNNRANEAEAALNALQALTPLNHFISFERYRWKNTVASKNKFVDGIRNEMRHETFLELADWYQSTGQLLESLEVLSLAPENPVMYYRIAFLKDQLHPGSGKEFIEKANSVSPLLVFPFRASTAEVLAWATEQTADWKPKYYLALIHWSRNNHERAKELFEQCGNPDFAPFYAARAEVMRAAASAASTSSATGAASTSSATAAAATVAAAYSDDMKRAARLDPRQWRYGKMLADHYVEQKKYSEAHAVASEYHKRFPDDFRIKMLLARTLLLNKEYKATTDLLAKTTILPYEGATDGRQMYREAWLMQAVDQIRSRNYKSALGSIRKAKLWPENLGAGKPYEEDIDLRLESYMEALVYEKTKQEDVAKIKYQEIIEAKRTGRNQPNSLITALALKKMNRKQEGEKLLKEWLAKEPANKVAQWANSIYYGEEPELHAENDNLKILKEVAGLR